MPDPLGVPEYAEPPFVAPHVAHRVYGIVHAEELMVPCNEFPGTAAGVAVQDEVFRQVQKLGLFAGPPYGSLKGYYSMLGFVIDLFPLPVMLPLGGGAADFCPTAVGEHDERVIPEELRNGVLIVPNVVLVRVLQFAMRLLEFHQQKRNAVDEAHQISPALVHMTGHPEAGWQGRNRCRWGCSSRSLGRSRRLAPLCHPYK